MSGRNQQPPPRLLERDVHRDYQLQQRERTGTPPDSGERSRWSDSDREEKPRKLKKRAKGKKSKKEKWVRKEPDRGYYNQRGGGRGDEGPETDEEGLSRSEKRARARKREREEEGRSDRRTNAADSAEKRRNAQRDGDDDGDDPDDTICFRWPRFSLRRLLDPLGVFDPHHGKEDELDTFPQKWRYLYPIERIRYIIYIGPLLFVLISLAVVMYLPFTFFSSCQPDPFRGKTNQRKRGRKAPRTRNDDALRDVCAPIGYGPYFSVRIDSGAEGERPRYISRWRSFLCRIWDMYSLIRDITRIFSRQGLQVLGVVCGATMAIMQIIRVGMELQSAQIGEIIEASFTGGGMELWKEQADCAYVVGTGLANWGEGRESFVWYILYHGWVLLLCFMLIADEVLNVRMGLLAPQWSRAGNGYTLIFLALCLINSSPNWGWKIMIPVHHFILIGIVACGAYQVVRLALVMADCTPDRSFARDNRRACRLPLRPWTKEQWKDAWRTGNFRENRNTLEDLQKAEMDLEDAQQRERRGEKSDGNKAHVAACEAAVDEEQEKLDKLYPAELLQTLIGDHARELRDLKEERAMRRDGEVFQRDDGGVSRVETLPESKKEIKYREERVREKGYMGRSLLHGGAIPHPRWTAEDHYLIARSIHSSYLTEGYDMDKFAKYTGMHPLSVEIAKQQRWIYDWKNDICEPVYIDKWASKPPVVETSNGKKCTDFEWETEFEFEERQKRNRKGLEGYVGCHDWSSSNAKYKHKSYRWFNIRRVIAIIVGTWMFFVHVAIVVTTYGVGTSNLPSYTAQHAEAAEAWKANNGPSDEACQYYQGSALAIWIRPGGNTYKGIILALIFFGAWEFFIMCMCLGVILVAVTNNRTFGMHLIVPISLIGPRLSSVSLGWTLSFVGAATLQMGLFHYEVYMQWFARLAGYACIATWILFLWPNEEMMSTVSRRPFLPALSLWAHEWLDGKVVHKRRRDAEYE